MPALSSGSNANEDTPYILENLFVIFIDGYVSGFAGGLTRLESALTVFGLTGEDKQRIARELATDFLTALNDVYDNFKEKPDYQSLMAGRLQYNLAHPRQMIQVSDNPFAAVADDVLWFVSQAVNKGLDLNFIKNKPAYAEFRASAEKTHEQIESVWQELQSQNPLEFLAKLYLTAANDPQALTKINQWTGLSFDILPDLMAQTEIVYDPLQAQFAATFKGTNLPLGCSRDELNLLIAIAIEVRTLQNNGQILQYALLAGTFFAVIGLGLASGGSVPMLMAASGATTALQEGVLSNQRTNTVDTAQAFHSAELFVNPNKVEALVHEDDVMDDLAGQNIAINTALGGFWVNGAGAGAVVFEAGSSAIQAGIVQISNEYQLRQAGLGSCDSGEAIASAMVMAALLGGAIRAAGVVAEHASSTSGKNTGASKPTQTGQNGDPGDPWAALRERTLSFNPDAPPANQGPILSIEEALHRRMQAQSKQPVLVIYKDEIYRVVSVDDAGKVTVQSQKNNNNIYEIEGERLNHLSIYESDADEVALAFPKTSDDSIADYLAGIQSLQSKLRSPLSHNVEFTDADGLVWRVVSCESFGETQHVLRLRRFDQNTFTVYERTISGSEFLDIQPQSNPVTQPADARWMPSSNPTDKLIPPTRSQPPASSVEPLAVGSRVKIRGGDSKIYVVRARDENGFYLVTPEGKIKGEVRPIEELILFDNSDAWRPLSSAEKTSDQAAIYLENGTKVLGPDGKVYIVLDYNPTTRDLNVFLEHNPHQKSDEIDIFSDMDFSVFSVNEIQIPTS